MRLMNARRIRLGTIAAGAAITLSTIAPAWADHRMTLPVGTVIPVTLDQSLDSRHSQPGDKFTATVREGRDDAGLPFGTKVEGVVREALPSTEGKPGVLDVDFRRLVIPGGETKSIEGTLYTLNGKDVQRRDGRLVASADKGKDRLKWIGIGAGAGALIGTLAKGNAFVDALLGAGAGYLYNELQNKKPGEVNLKAGTEFGVRMDRLVAFNVDDRSYYRFRDRVKGDIYNDDRYYRDNDRNSDRDSDRDRNRDDQYYRYGDRYGRIDATDIGMVIDRREVRFGSAKPFMRRDVVFIPLEPVSKAMGVKYSYNADDRVIRARNGDIRLNIGSRVAFVNGERRTLPAPAEVRDGVVYVPMEFLSWFTGGSTSWDGASRTVIVTTERDRDRDRD